MILLWGLPNERPLAAVHAAARELGAECVVVDQRRIEQTRIELDLRVPGAGELAVDGRTIALADVRAAYLRPYETERIPAVRYAGRWSPLWWHATGVEVLLSTWAELTPALVVNRLEPMTTNNSKPYQATLISRCGFAVPETLVTTDPEAVRDFWDEHEQVVYKSLSATRSRVSRLDEAHLDRLATVRACPTQFQRYVPGEDIRVHVVGTETFACEIRSPADDYRYASADAAPTVQETELPAEVAQRCVKTAAALELSVAGIDLRLSDDGEWFCFEVNPSPGFSFYADRTGQPIAQAIARLLSMPPAD